MVISPVTLPDNYGVFEKDGELCMWLDMEEIHECGLVKYDFLILKSVQVIRDAYRMLGKPYPKSHEIDWDDQEVWSDMIRHPTGIFQFESAYAFDLLRRFKPTSIFDMSLVTAAARPSGTSYRDRLIKREKNKNPSKMIDDLLAENNGFLIYQEDTIKFLQQICGLSGSEADNVRRAIGRKQTDRLQAALPRILDGYCGKSDKPREVAENEARAFLQILEDSASYQFGRNHSIAYCLIGYVCAYLRYYHPYEFITSYLNNAANSEDITNGTELARVYGISMSQPRWGLSSDEYIYNKEKSVIAKGLESIKYLNSTVAKEMFRLSKETKFEFFVDLLLALKTTSLDARQLNILILTDFFAEFGNSAELSRISEWFDFLKAGEAKQIKKEGLAEEISSLLSMYATDTNSKGAVLKSYTITDMHELLIAGENKIRSLNLPDLDLRLKMEAQREYLGYVDLTSGREEDKLRLYIEDISPLKDKGTGKPWCYRLTAKSIGTGKTARLSVKPHVYNETPIKAGDIIDTAKENYYKNKSDYWYLLMYDKVI